MALNEINSWRAPTPLGKMHFRVPEKELKPIFGRIKGAQDLWGQQLINWIILSHPKANMRRNPNTILHNCTTTMDSPRPILDHL